MVFLMLCLIVTSLLLFLSKLLKEFKIKDINSSSSFECGFNPQSKKNIFITGQFFLISIIFIIFDLEISLIIPLLGENQVNLKISLILLTMIVIFLMGTLIEWKTGMMEWVK